MEDFRDDELKKWLAEEYEKETEEMEKILFPDGVIPDDGETEEEAKAAYQRLVEKLKADGVYKEDETDSIKTDDHKENVKIVYLPEKKSHKAARVAAAVLVCSAGIFAASMTSQANRSYFIDSVKVWTGNDTKIVVDNDPSSDVLSMDEDKARDDINEQLGIKVPYFMYRPQKFKYLDYEVDKMQKFAFMEYQHDDKVITLYMDQNIDNQNSIAIGLDGKQIKKIVFDDENITITLLAVRDKADKEKNYVAYWKYEEVYYQVSGKMPENEFEKLIENMRF